MNPRGPENVDASGPAAVAVGRDNHGSITTNIVLPPHEVSWPVCTGAVPELASAFQPRHDLRDHIQAARRHGSTRILAGGGGVGKSQLAAWFAHQAIEDPAVDLVVWVVADSPEQIAATYARAAERVGAQVTGDAADDATAFLEWLRATGRTWLIVLDDITDPAHLSGLWPPARPAGWTLATTRLHDAALASSGRQRVDIGVYTPEESAAYFENRLTGAGMSHLLDEKGPDLAVALGHLPLALSHAAAYMANQDEPSAAYLDRYLSGRENLADLMPAGTDPDGYGRSVGVTLLLALDAADTAAPAGLARRALALTSVLDPAGHPEALWATGPVTGYLTGHGGAPVTPEQARRSLRLLHRYALITHTGADPVRSVRIHALTARAMRETLPDPVATAQAAADALCEIWPAGDRATLTFAALQANVATLHTVTGEDLWRATGYRVLWVAGSALVHAGQYAAAVAHWRTVAEQAERFLGVDHVNALTARAGLADACRQAGRATEAITLLERTAADCVRVLGPDSQETMFCRFGLAGAYWLADRRAEAVTQLEDLITDFDRLFGPDEVNTLTARSDLAVYYGQMGRTAEAIVLLEQVVAANRRRRGADHRETLKSQANLAAAYSQAGRLAEAVSIKEQLVVESERLLGPDHPNTSTQRSNLAFDYRAIGRIPDAIALVERVLADRGRVLGADHPSTQNAAMFLRELHAAARSHPG
ncbi:tetratricopeptide repeat protein [Actinoplanes sp. CA-142083]|uniref:tetratricopeptide repeat protein n=1 Tax=Actinoplanes sp. CA-142083 TaxID=3239903 RepID=UPI003D8BBB49